MIEPIAWNLFFDGSRSKDGAGAGCVLVDPKETKTMIACRIKFECTNNVAKYEALVQGLSKMFWHVCWPTILQTHGIGLTIAFSHCIFPL